MRGGKNMERKFKMDTLSFKLEDVSNILSIFKKDIKFMYNNIFYEITSNPFFDLDSKEVHLQVQYEDFEHYLKNI